MREQLLRQALESGKTTSKKQRSKNDSQASAGMSRSGSRKTSAANSGAASPIASHGGSLAGSRQPSDDESSDSGRGSPGSNGDSIDGILAGATDSLSMSHSWEQTLTTRIDEILHRSRRSQDERESDLKWYLGLTQNHYASEQVSPSASQLAKIFVRVAASDSDYEALLALKCLAITVFTDQSEDFYEICLSGLKHLIAVHDSERVMAEAINSLAVVVFASGDLEYFTETLPYLLEIIATDGDQVDAPDSALVVTAAIEAHQLLISGIEDEETLQEISQETMEALVAQLDSSAATVTVAAGEAIALLWVKSWRPAEKGEEEYDSDASDSGARMVQMYKPYRNMGSVQATMKRLANTSARSTGKRDRQSIKQTFDDVMHTLDNPRAGPRFSDSQGWKPAGRDARKGKTGGAANKMKVRVNDGGIEGLMTVDEWWKLVRVRTVQRYVGQGLMTHWAANEVVRECLTVP